MKIPANGTTRLSQETWVEAEALRRYQKKKNIRKAVESAVSHTVNAYLSDPDFVAILQAVRQESDD